MKLRCWLAVFVMGLLVAGAQAADAVSSPGAYGPNILTDPADRRGEEQTFLTFPEWFLVFSPAEYAEFVRNRTPDEFCFWAHIGQFWDAYGSVIHETRIRREPTNWGYHLMIVVIGVSTTVEYAMRSAYETVVGRIFAATSAAPTPEDRYGAVVAQEYVDFIRGRPWFEFDFLSRLRRLWTQTDLVGPQMLRKWERKYALTTEYTVKAMYGWVIGKATNATYDPVIPTTSVVVGRWPVCEQTPANVRVVKEVGGETLLSLPRYAPFQTPAVELAHCGADFREIAGNRTVILLSVTAPTGTAAPPDTEVMARQPIVTEPGRERVLLIVPVAKLGNLLAGAGPATVRLEHIFDY